jgi:hypothetical protein
LPSQYATAAGEVTPLRRNVTATGAAQHVHIIDGMPAAPPASALEIGWQRFKARGSHERGNNACTDALISNATNRAGHIDDQYAWKNVAAACHEGLSPACTEPTVKMLRPDQ